MPFAPSSMRKVWQAQRWRRSGGFHRPSWCRTISAAAGDIKIWTSLRKIFVSWPTSVSPQGRSSSSVRRSAVQDAPPSCASSVNCLIIAAPGRHARTASCFRRRGVQACRELCRARAASSELIWTPLKVASGEARYSQFIRSNFNVFAEFAFKSGTML